MSLKNEQGLCDLKTTLANGVSCCGIRLTIDWTFLSVEIIARLLLLLAGILIYTLCDPFVRKVWPSQWYDYAYPYTENQKFDGTVSVLICIGVPLFFLITFLVLLRERAKWRRSLVFEETIFFLLGYVLAVLVVFVLCEFIKRLYGRLRPDYLARCFGTNNATEWGVLIRIPEIPDCSNSVLSQHDLDDGRMSFPSEHSGLTWAVFTFTSLWVYGKLCLFHNTGAFRLIVPFAILLLPTAIAISRTSDYRHHASDVFGGSLLGAVIAILVYCFYWPLSMKPLVADIYCIFESSAQGKLAKLREVTAAKLRVVDPALFKSPEYLARRKDFFRGNVCVDRMQANYSEYRSISPTVPVASGAAAAGVLSQNSTGSSFSDNN